MGHFVDKYIKPYWLRMSLGFSIKFLGSIMDLFIPYILAYIIDSVIPTGERLYVFTWGMIMVLCSILCVTFNVVANRMAAHVAGDAIEVVRHDLFEKIMGLSNKQTDGFTKPSLISRMTSDTYNLHQMISRIQRLGVRAPILLLGGIAVTFTLDPFMALVLVAILPALAFITFTVSARSIPMFAGIQEASDRFVRMVRENISGIRVIKALSKADVEVEHFREINQEVVDKDRRAGMVMAIVNPSMTILLNLGLVTVILVGAVRVNNGTTEVGKILAFTTYFTIILHAMMSISRMFTLLSKGIASGNRVMEVLECEDDMLVSVINEMEETDREAKAAIEFRHVSFSYNPERDYINDLSFVIKPGETLGIIGEIGSGKSTIINLMMRMYDIAGGQVMICGRDVRQWPPEELKEIFGVVFQNDTIFEDTIANNITLGRDIAPEALHKALACSQALEFVSQRETGELEELNIKGANLSGGQKQRVLVARALAGEPKILILDDSSSALDYKTDAEMRRAIRENYQNTTMVIVAQRVSSIMSADHILVLEDGKPIGFGTHDELMASCKTYSDIAETQMNSIK